MKRNKLVYLTNCYGIPSDVNVGASTRHFYTVERLVDDGFDVCVITADASGISDRTIAFEDSENIVTVKTSKLGSSSLSARLKFIVSYFWNGLFEAFRRAKGADLIFCSTPTLLIAIKGLLVSKMRSTKFVVDVRDLWADSLAGTKYGTHRWFLSLNRWVESFVYRKADLIFCTTEPQCRSVVEMGVEPSRVELAPNAFDFNLVSNLENCSSVTYREVQDLKNRHSKVIMFAGKHSNYTNLSVVLSAAQILGDEFAVVLIGGGYEKPELQSNALQNGIDNVYFFDPVPKEEVLSILSCANILLINYSDSDAWAKVIPNKLYDYLYFEKPIVAAVCSGEISRIIGETNAGIVVQPGDAIALASAIQSVGEKFNADAVTGRSYLRTHYDRVVITKRVSERLLILCDNRNA